jgi:hypothetical protein
MLCDRIPGFAILRRTGIPGFAILHRTGIPGFAILHRTGIPGFAILHRIPGFTILQRKLVDITYRNRTITSRSRYRCK